MALLSHAVGRTERLSAWNEVFALVLLFAGTLLFFALISYTPKDILSWLWFSHVSPANHPAQNFIGPVGAIVARSEERRVGKECRTRWARWLLSEWKRWR